MSSTTEINIMTLRIGGIEILRKDRMSMRMNQNFLDIQIDQTEQTLCSYWKVQEYSS